MTEQTMVAEPKEKRPKNGQKDYCKLCHHPIYWSGKFWKHKHGMNVMHIAEPYKWGRTDESIRAD